MDTMTDHRKIWQIKECAFENNIESLPQENREKYILELELTQHLTEMKADMLIIAICKC